MWIHFGGPRLPGDKFKTLYSEEESCKCFKDKLNNLFGKVNDATIPDNALYWNSNSVLSEALKALDLPLPSYDKVMQNDDAPCKCIFRRLQAVTDHFNKEQFKYDPLAVIGTDHAANSNSVFYDLLAAYEQTDHPTVPEDAYYGNLYTSQIALPGFYHPK